MLTLDSATTITVKFGGEAVYQAAADLQRDIAKVFTAGGRNDGAYVEQHNDGGAGSDNSAIEIAFAADVATEAYIVQVTANRLQVLASDDLGAVYGLYAISRELLGVSDLWFWNDQQFDPIPAAQVPSNFRLSSPAMAVRFRGFFINDEVLLSDWSIAGDLEAPWQAAFEALLRLGGNLVIPGSGQGREPRFAAAAARGLWVTQHHTTPLGARMFADAYPGLAPQWPEQRDKFEALWQDAIAAANPPDPKVIWTLGFRGQGDLPFWANDPRYTTDSARGELLSQIINRQYELVQAAIPGAPCCAYLYGEAMELYRGGHLDIPDNVVLIWSDNGYGRMVSRRQGNHNPRIPALPDPSRAGRQGIYYHVSFYDLQAANHITPLSVDPQLVADELAAVLASGGSEVWIINCSNIKPHVYLLSLIAEIWRTGPVDVNQFTTAYARRYYGDLAAPAVVAAITEYWQAAIKYGAHWDDVGGEQLLNHVPRMLAVAFLADRQQPCPELAWLSEAGSLGDAGSRCCDESLGAAGSLSTADSLPEAGSLQEQVALVRGLAAPAAARYRKLAAQIEVSALQLPPAPARLLRDSWLLATQVLGHCAQATVELCDALDAAWAGDYLQAFYHAGLAAESYDAANSAMRAREHGKWLGFWRNDCLVDVKHSAAVMRTLLGYFRALGDGPHYHGWKRQFLYPPNERDVMVITNMENHETDAEMFAAIKAELES